MEQEKKTGKPVITINGVEYKLRFDMYSLEKIEEEFGGSAKGMEAIRGKGSMKAMRKMFAILANSQRNLDGLPEDVTGDEIDAHAPLSLVMELVNAIDAAAEEGRRAETINGGPADDKKQNPLDLEYDKSKN